MGTAVIVSIAALALVACGNAKKDSLVSDGSSPGGSASFDGGVSPGTASIVFTVAGTDTYCANVDDCGGGLPTIGIDAGTGSSSCTSVDCASCRAFGCLEIVCQNIAGTAITGGQFEWNGAYGTESTCGAGISCVATVFAKPGRYTATMCATPGTLVGSDAGPPQCVASGPQKCGHVDFDFPSEVVAMGTIGP